MSNLYLQNKELTNYNSFRTKAFAKYYAEPRSVEEINECINTFSNENLLILGAGCNLFFTQNFDGLVLRPQLFGIKKIDCKSINNDEILIEAMASENWDNFVEYCVEKNYSNLENLSLIPGTVGASPVQNIGAYGVEVKDCIYRVKAIDIQSNELKIFENNECEFTYRNSIFKQTNRYVIISVTFLLKKNFDYVPKYIDLNIALENISKPTIKDVREAVIKIRKHKLPNEIELPNAGSFFKNPYLSNIKAKDLTLTFPDIPLFNISEDLVKTSAAFLIDKAGFKGLRIGNIGTYPKQPLIIVNYGSDNGNDIVSFMQIIQKKVYEIFNISLEPEVRIL